MFQEADVWVPFQMNLVPFQNEKSRDGSRVFSSPSQAPSFNVSTVRSRIVILPLVGAAGAAAHRPF